MSYITDPRTQRAAEKPVIYFYDEVTDEENVVELPTHWEVCDLCEGEGSHVNPSIDCNGLDEEQENDPDFMGDYLSGKYDIACNRCGGKRVIQEVNWDAVSEEHKHEYHRQQQWEHESRQEQLAELRAGC
jgi:hypothetical protein